MLDVSEMDTTGREHKEKGKCMCIFEEVESKLIQKNSKLILGTIQWLETWWTLITT